MSALPTICMQFVTCLPCNRAVHCGCHHRLGMYAMLYIMQQCTPRGVLSGL